MCKFVFRHTHTHTPHVYIYIIYIYIYIYIHLRYYVVRCTYIKTGMLENKYTRTYIYIYIYNKMFLGEIYIFWIYLFCSYICVIYMYYIRVIYIRKFPACCFRQRNMCGSRHFKRGTQWDLNSLLFSIINDSCLVEFFYKGFCSSFLEYIYICTRYIR